MDSRIRLNPSRIFEVFLELGYEPTGDPIIIQKYPEDFDDTKFLKDVSRFAFPYGEIPERFSDDLKSYSVVDHFTFVLTDIEGKFRFGFCRHSSETKTCLCIISFLPWYEVFYKLLNHLAEIFNRSVSPGNAFSLLHAAYVKKFFMGATQLTISPSDVSQKFSFTLPNLNGLPTIPQSRNLTEYYNAIDVDNMITIYASLMQERRVLVVSRKLSRLTACIHAAACLIYPMFWQHLYIPVLPNFLLDHCSAPMPYIIGVHSSLREYLRPQELGDAVILDADNNKVHSEYDDVGDLPNEVVTRLKKSLKASKSGNSLMGDGVARAFLRATACLIGGYREALVVEVGKPVRFDEELFIASRPQKMQEYLRKMLRLQIFEQFIAERVKIFNNLEEPADEFENEVAALGDKWSSKSRYQEWIVDMKKFQKEGKEKFANLKNKVRERGKKAVNDVNSKVDHVKKENYKQISRDRPGTVPLRSGKSMFYKETGGSTIVQYRKYSNVNRNSSFRRAQDNQVVVGIDGQRKSRRSNRISFDDMELPPKINLDLSNDPDIVNVLKKRSMEDLRESYTDDDEDEADVNSYEEMTENSGDDDNDISVDSKDDYHNIVVNEEKTSQHLDVSDLLVPLDVAQTTSFNLKVSHSQVILTSPSSCTNIEALSSSSASIDSNLRPSTSDNKLSTQECTSNVLANFVCDNKSTGSFGSNNRLSGSHILNSHLSQSTPSSTISHQPIGSTAKLLFGDAQLTMQKATTPSQQRAPPVPDQSVGSFHATVSSSPAVNRDSVIMRSLNSRSNSAIAEAHRSYALLEPRVQVQIDKEFGALSPQVHSAGSNISLPRPTSIGKDLLEFDPLQNSVASSGSMARINEQKDETSLLHDWKAEHFTKPQTMGQTSINIGPVFNHSQGSTMINSNFPQQSMSMTSHGWNQARPNVPAYRPQPLPYSTFSRSPFTPLPSIPGANVRSAVMRYSSLGSNNPYVAMPNQISTIHPSSAIIQQTPLSDTIVSNSYNKNSQHHNPVTTGIPSPTKLVPLLRTSIPGATTRAMIAPVGPDSRSRNVVSPLSIPVIGGQVRPSLIDLEQPQSGRTTLGQAKTNAIISNENIGSKWQTFD